MVFDFICGSYYNYAMGQLAEQAGVWTNKAAGKAC